MVEARQITFEPNVQEKLDGQGEVFDEFVTVGGQYVGWVKKPKHGPGFFLHVAGATWQNAPGARYPTENDARTQYTYCKTRKRVREVVAQHFNDKAKKLATE